MFNFHIILYNPFSSPCRALSPSVWIHHQNGDSFVNFVQSRGWKRSCGRLSDSNSLFLHAASSLVRICVSGSAQDSSSVRPPDWLSAADFRFLWRLVLFFWLLTRKKLSNYWLLASFAWIQFLSQIFRCLVHTRIYRVSFQNIDLLRQHQNLSHTDNYCPKASAHCWQCFPLRMRSVLEFCPRVGWCCIRPVYKLTVPKKVVE